jgi:hypothetical protein
LSASARAPTTVLAAAQEDEEELPRFDGGLLPFGDGRPALSLPSFDDYKRGPAKPLPADDGSFRSKLTLLSITLTLQPDIAPRPLRKLLDRLHRVLVDPPRLANEPASARLSSATPSAITVEVSAIALTGDDDEHLAIREEVLLTMMEVIRACGCDSSAEPTVSPAMIRAAA